MEAKLCFLWGWAIITCCVVKFVILTGQSFLIQWSCFGLLSYRQITHGNFWLPLCCTNRKFAIHKSTHISILRNKFFSLCLDVNNSARSFERSTSCIRSANASWVKSKGSEDRDCISKTMSLNSSAGKWSSKIVSNHLANIN